MHIHVHVHVYVYVHVHVHGYVHGKLHESKHFISYYFCVRMFMYMHVGIFPPENKILFIAVLKPK